MKGLWGARCLHIIKSYQLGAIEASFRSDRLSEEAAHVEMTFRGLLKQVVMDDGWSLFVHLPWPHEHGVLWHLLTQAEAHPLSAANL